MKYETLHVLEQYNTLLRELDSFTDDMIKTVKLGEAVGDTHTGSFYTHLSGGLANIKVNLVNSIKFIEDLQQYVKNTELKPGNMRSFFLNNLKMAPGKMTADVLKKVLVDEGRKLLPNDSAKFEPKPTTDKEK